MSTLSPLRAALAGRPPDDQVAAMIRIGRCLRAGLAARGTDTREADVSLALAERWAAGEAVTGAAFSDAVYSEMGEGLAGRHMAASDPVDAAFWNAMTTAIMIIAWHVYTRNGERMPSDVCEVDDLAFDYLDAQWRETGAYDEALFAG